MGKKMLNKMNKRIYIELSGVASSGKTTVAKQIRDVLGVQYKTEIVLEAIRDNSVDFERMNTDPEYAFEKEVEFTIQQRDKILAEINTGTEIIICDRSMDDMVVYSKIYFGENKEHMQIIEYMRDEWYKILKENNWDCIKIKLNDLPLENDGFRNVNIREKEEFYFNKEPCTHFVDDRKHINRIITILRAIRSHITQWDLL